ncbi:MAG: GYF domain-containing protein [Sandaracinaceae bacterium]
MKIVCDSCGAKYSIADEKVAGRIFKIRCKKCSAPIVVRGDQVGVAAAQEGPQPHDYGTEPQWHVVVDGEQQGPYPPSQVAAMLSEGTITWDAYVWREGFEDWKPAQEVPELVGAVSGEGPAPAASSDPYRSATAGAAGAAVDPGPFGAEQDEPGHDAAADLFAQPAAFGAPSPEDEDVVASSNAPRASAERSLTGARNENSVLFSLSNLQALATGGGGDEPAAVASASPASGAPGRPGTAQGEGSGLIDIRALAAATSSSAPSAGPITSRQDDKVDDLLSIGAPSPGLNTLGAPVVVPEPREERRGGGIGLGLGIGIGAGLFAAAAALAFVGYQLALSGDDDDTGAAAIAPIQQPTPPTGAGTPPTPPPSDGTAAGGEGDETATADEDEDEDGEEESASSRSGRSSRSARDGQRSRRSSRSSAAEATPPPQQDSSSRSRSSSQNDDLLSLIDRATGENTSSARSRPQEAERPSQNAQPSRSDVRRAMDSVAGQVRACGNGTHGTARVQVVFQGTSGRVTTATVEAANLPPPVRSCIARAVRGARVPSFSQSTFSVRYPFNL